MLVARDKLYSLFHSLLDGGIGDQRGVADLLAELLEHLPPVGLEVAVDLVDGLVLDHPQLALRVADQPLVVTAMR